MGLCFKMFIWHTTHIFFPYAVAAFCAWFFKRFDEIPLAPQHLRHTKITQIILNDRMSGILQTKIYMHYIK